MNGRERMLTALNRGIPDRVPHWELAYNESSIINIARHFTKDVPEIDFIQRMDLETKVKLFDTVVMVVNELDIDGLTLRPFSSTTFIDDERFVDDWGVTFQVHPAGESVVLDGPVSCEDDLKSYKPPTIQESDLLALNYAADQLNNEKGIVLSLQCPFRRSWNMVGGMTNLLIAYMTNSNFAHKLARIATDFTKETIELGVKLGAHIISLDGDLAHNTNTIISPQHFREFLKPYYTELVDFTHGLGLPIFKHTDGDHSKITEDLLETGLDGIHPIQPQCLDIGKVKKEIGDRICIIGNIDCIETLVSKNTTDVEEEVRRTIKIAAPGGGYILSSSNSIHPGVKSENYIAMVQAAHKYGTYD
ncbi:MAG: uroporphyrinogen decarboxylase family protein [Thermodesulfobacteriota bacterium]